MNDLDSILGSAGYNPSEFRRRFPEAPSQFLVYNRGLQQLPREEWQNSAKLPAGINLLVLKLSGSVVKRRTDEDTDRVISNVKWQVQAIQEQYNLPCVVITSGATVYGGGKTVEHLTAGQQRLMERHSNVPPHYQMKEALFDTTRMSEPAHAHEFVQELLEIIERGAIPYVNASPGSFAVNPRDNSTVAADLAVAFSQLGRKPLTVFAGKFPGVYTKEGFKQQGPGQYLIRVVHDPEGIEKHTVHDGSETGYGGIDAALEAAKRNQQFGLCTVMLDGMHYHHNRTVQEHLPLYALLSGRLVGTRFMPREMWM